LQRRRFFELLWDRVLAPGGGYVLVAELQGEPIAAAVFLVDERTTIYKYGASDQRHLKTRPNHALFWEAITDACARGHRRFDFGRSDFGGEGLRRFKSSWGARSWSWTTRRSARRQSRTKVEAVSPPSPQR
jgi:CelD/BcsL family acetyltransferase involved in cellulose biosynthesis